MTRAVALVAAAGLGTRMGETLPKQYVEIGDRPMLWYSLNVFCAHPAIHRTFVALHADDRIFANYPWECFSGRLVPLFCGGATRAQSVMHGLEHMRAEVHVDDWVLVHDAARPCLTSDLVERLMGEVSGDAVGGLLAVPLADTLKRDDDQHRSVRSEARDGLWQAQTPQMFRFGLLLQALRAADPVVTTDEASALEQLGHRPRLVMGSAANLKVTYPEDLALAAMILQARKQ